MDSDLQDHQIPASKIAQMQCITEDLKCLITFLALCLQAVVLISLIAISYIIIQVTFFEASVHFYFSSAAVI